MGTPPTLPPVGLTCALKGPHDHLRGECTATRAFSESAQRQSVPSYTTNSCHLPPNARQQLAHRLRRSMRTPVSSTGYKRPEHPASGHASSAPARGATTRARTIQTGGHSGTHHPHRCARHPDEQERRKPATLPTPQARRQLTPRLVRTRRIRQGGPDPHRVWPACRKQCLERADHADASLLSTTRPSSSKVPMASRRRISSGQCAMKSRASTV